MQIKLAIRDLWKYREKILFIWLEMFFSILCFIFAYTQMSEGISTMQLLNKMKHKETIYFEIEADEQFHFDTSADEYITNLLNHKSGYSIVESTSSDSVPDTKIVAVLGDFSDYVKNPSEEEKNAVALIGNNVKNLNVGDTISYGIDEIQVEVVGRLENNSKFLCFSYMEPLNDCVLIFIQKDEFTSIFRNMYLDEIVAKFHYFYKDSEEYIGVIENMSKFYEAVTPRLLSEGVDTVQQDNYQSGKFFTIFYIGVLCFAVLNVFLAIKQVFSDNKIVYVIHGIYGADALHLFLRKAVFLGIVVGVPMVWGYYIFHLFVSM